MSNNQSSQKSLAISICLLFLLVPLLGIIDFPEDLEKLREITIEHEL